MSKDCYLVVLSDIHSGHKLGLLNPDTELFDNNSKKPYKPPITEAQEYLWELYMYGLGEIKQITKGKDVYVLILGDVTHGNKHQDQTISTRMADQISIARSALRPTIQMKNVKAVRFAIGTGSHEFGEGSSALLLEEIMKEEYKGKDIKLVTHGLLNVGGKLIDYAHHGPGVGMRSWLHGNNLRFYLRDILLREERAGNKKPDLVLRGHVHGLAFESLYEVENNSLVKRSIMIVPSMCMMGEFARQVTRSQHIVTNGIVAFHINGNISDPNVFVQSLDIRLKEEL